MDITPILETQLKLSKLKSKMLKQCIEFIYEYLSAHDGKFEFNDGEFYYDSLKGLCLKDEKPCYVFDGGYSYSIDSFHDDALACNVCFHLNEKDWNNNAGHME